MKIAFATWKFPALANTFILNEIVEVKKRGHDVSIYTIDPSDDRVVHDDVATYGLLERTHALERYIPKDHGGEAEAIERGLANYRADWLGDKVHALEPIARRMQKQGVDLVHGCFANNSATVAMLLARFAGLPFTFECHALDLFVDLRYADEKLDEAARIFPISDYNRRYLIDELGCAPEKLVIRRVPINKAFCDSLPAVERDPGLVVFVGRLAEIKGLRDAIVAVAKVAERRPEVRFRIIGDGELREELEQLVTQLGASQHVEFAGTMTNQAALQEVSRAAAFLLPSVIAGDGDRDGIPTSMIEAMYLRTPVVSTRVSGIPELIEDGADGLLAEPGDVDEIASKLERLLADAELRTVLGDEARTRVDREFDTDRNIDILVREWQAIVDSRPKPGLFGRLFGRLFQTARG